MTLPEPPLLVLAIRKANDGRWRKSPEWFFYQPRMIGAGYFIRCSLYPISREANELRVIPHDKNDPEAVELIEAAKLKE